MYLSLSLSRALSNIHTNTHLSICIYIYEIGGLRCGSNNHCWRLLVNVRDCIQGVRTAAGGSCRTCFVYFSFYDIERSESVEDLASRERSEGSRNFQQYAGHGVGMLGERRMPAPFQEDSAAGLCGPLHHLQCGRLHECGAHDAIDGHDMC